MKKGKLVTSKEVVEGLEWVDPGQGHWRELDLPQHWGAVHVVAAMAGDEFVEGSDLDKLADRIVASYNYCANLPMSALTNHVTLDEKHKEMLQDLEQTENALAQSKLYISELKRIAQAILVELI